MRIYNYIKLVIFIAFSVLIFVFKDSLLVNLKYLVASLLIAFGTENLLVIGILKRKECLKETKFIFGFIQLLLGLVVMFGVEDFTSVCIIWAVWSISRESFEIYEITSGIVRGPAAVISGIESIIAITFSVMLLINPTEHHAKIHIYLLIVEFLVTAFSPVVSELVYNFKNKKSA